MNERRYKKYIEASLGHESQKYINGYQLGLRRLYKNSAPLDEIIKEAWTEEYLRGFKDGITGKPPEGTDGRIANVNTRALALDSYLKLRISAEEKAVFKAYAKLHGKSLSEWIIEACRDDIQKNV